ncbi:MAG TPA: pilus assembly protein TadG-related protein [Candidatus Dormibacteraeota bacterium]
MRPRARSVSQSGQAIVLVAVCLVVLFGFLGLAIDGGRAYLDRRELQAAVDAAALAAANDYMNSSNLSEAQQAASTVYMSNEQLYTGIACDNLGTATASCPYGGPTLQSLTIASADHSIAGVSFTTTAQHWIPVAIMQVFGVGPTIKISATATAVARRAGTSGAAILTLSQAGCGGGGGGGGSLTVSGTSNTVVTGDVWSNGSITVNGGATASVAGNVVDICPSVPPALSGFTLVCSDPARSTPPCPTGYSSGSEVNGWAQPDPGYASPTLNATPRTFSASTVLMQPGTFAANPRLSGGAGCYFMAAGAYDWSAGLTVNGGFMSNELRPPDEPVFNDNKTRAATQFWNANGVGCAGSFQPYPNGSDSSNSPVTPQTYGVEVTAVRWEPYGVASCTGPQSSSCFLRESAPSMCRLVDIAASEVFKVWLSNVPGADYYNVYADPTGTCSGPFGFVTQFSNTASEGNGHVSGCAPALTRNQAPPNPFNNCDLGSASVTVNGSKMPSGWAPSSTAAPGTAGAYPPNGEGAPIASGLPNSDPPPGTWPAGDRANENYCVGALGSPATCPAAGSPGAILNYVPGGGATSVCLNLQGGGDVYEYSGEQFQRVLLFEPGPLQAPPANTCPNNVNGHGLTSLLGIFYLPAASATITGNSGYFATIAGGVIAYTATIRGNGAVAITADPTLRPWPSAVHLTN